MVEHAAMTINFGRRGPDGRTAWELRHGRPFRRCLAGFSEKIMYLPGGKRASRLEDKFLPGIYLGQSLRTDESLIGTSNGVVRARTVRRLPEGDRKDRELLLSVKGSLWKPVPADETLDEAPARIHLPVPMAVAAALPDPLPPRGQPVPGEPRRVNLRRGVELMKYGFTADCMGCISAEAGTSAQAHSEACWNRITDAMRQDRDGAVRVDESDRRKRKTDEMIVPTTMDVETGASSFSAGPAAASAPMSGAAEPDEDMVGTDLGNLEVNECVGALLALGLDTKGSDIVELYCPGRLKDLSSLFGLTHGGAFDLRTGWDLSLAADREKCWATLLDLEPSFILGSLKCAPFSVLQHLNNDTQKARDKYDEGVSHMKFVAEVYT